MNSSPVWWLSHINLLNKDRSGIMGLRKEHNGHPPETSGRLLCVFDGSQAAIPMKQGFQAIKNLTTCVEHGA